MILPRLLFVLAATFAAAGMVHAASIQTETRANFSRISFDFGKPVRMQVGQGGNSVTLTFDTPLNASAANLNLPPHVKSASIGKDGKSLTLTLDQPYRVRQFVSGNHVGLDVLTGSAPAPSKPAEKPADSPKPAPKPAEAPKPAPAAKPAAPVAKPVAAKAAAPEPEPAPEPASPAMPEPVAEPLSSIRPAPSEPPPVAAPEPTAPEPAAAEAPEAIAATATTPDPLLTTKPVEASPEPAAAAPTGDTILTTVPPAPEPAEAVAALAPKPEEPATPAEPISIVPPTPDPLLTTVQPAATPNSAMPKAVATTPQAQQEISPEDAATANAPPPSNPDKPFDVTVSTDAGTATITFPWGVRTAGAVFERARDIWILFDREANAKPSQIASALPKQVVKVEQYRLPGATVLRLTTDGTLHATPNQPAGDYEWTVTLGPDMAKPALNIPVDNDAQGDSTGLLIKAFDTGKPYIFYDPDTRDRLIVIPTFENGRGVSDLRRFPELAVLPSPQGAVIATQRDDITAEKIRAGIRLSGKGPLAVSENLPIVAAGARPVPGASAGSGVLMPYDQWYVSSFQFPGEHHIIQRAIANAGPAQLADDMRRMVNLYLGKGMGVEALGYLTLIKGKFPAYYTEHSMGVLEAAANLLFNHMPEARAAVSDASLDGNAEAAMWRELLNVADLPPDDALRKLQQAAIAETEARQKAAAEAAVQGGGEIPEPEAPPVASRPLTFDFMRYNNDIIRYYPPRIRQKIAIIAAEAFITNGQPGEAVKVYDTLNRDGVLTSIQPYAEYALAVTASTKKGKLKDALTIYDRLGKESPDAYIQARARYDAIMLRYKNKMLSGLQTAQALESLRMGWRGDHLQRAMLRTLADIYTEAKQYDNTLRTLRTILDTFPNDPDTLTISGDMTELFQKLFLNGLADDMPPLKSLALFYEFRDLTPIGDNGDIIIQKLADRLAAVDLLDRATQLLEHQIKFRVSGEARARVGARLAVLYLLNHQPKEALGTLEVTNYGEAEKSLREQRVRLTAQALSDTGKHEEALSMLFSDDSSEADLLRLDILWAMKDWPNVINQAEDIISSRTNLTASLTKRETEVLMKLALGYSFEGDSTQLRYLRDYYTGLLTDGPYKEIFDFLTNDTSPLDPADFELVAQQISHTETFLDKFRKQVEAGELSNTVK